MTIKELKEKIAELNAELDVDALLIGAQSELTEALERELRDFFTVEQFEEIEAKQIGAALPWFVDEMKL